MSRPSFVVNLADVRAQKRPRFTSTPGVAALVQTLGDPTGLKQMGVGMRAVEPGFSGTNRHFHSAEEEWSFVLSGRGTLRIGPHRIAVSAGSFAGFPTGPRPHHFIAEGDEPLVFLEGGERRPAQDDVWYPDIRKMSRGRVLMDDYVEPPQEEGDLSQVVRVDEVELRGFQHDLDPAVRRQMRTLHERTGLTRQAVRWARVAAGGQSTVFHTHERTDEWVFVLSGRGIARVGDERIEIGPRDFLGHPAGGTPHVMEAVDELTYLVGGQIDASDVVTYPERGMRRVGEKLLKLE